MSRKELLHKTRYGKWRDESWPLYLGRLWRHGLCRVFGHAKLEQKMWCSICSRCRVVIHSTPQAKIYARIVK